MSQSREEQIVIPKSEKPNSEFGESMTFGSEASRQRYIREQRAYNWEVFLSHRGTDNHSGKELYAITRKKI